VVAALVKDGTETATLKPGEIGAVIVNQTPFYGESGGQVGDTGTITADGVRFRVTDTQKKVGDLLVHSGTVEQGTLKPGAAMVLEVDRERRGAIRANHSATHLLHEALRQVLGDHIAQKGSLVAPDRLRFDFSHPKPIDAAEMRQVEELANEVVLQNAPVETRLMDRDEAIATGAMALFGEKYGDEVRVLRFGDFSVELCGGTHVERVGDIGVFKITGESGVASGIRRIEAVTGKGALDWIDDNLQALDQVAGMLRSPRRQAAAKVDALLKRNKALERELAAAKQALISGGAGGVVEEITEIDGVKVLATRIDGADAKTLREAVDRYKDKLQTAVVVLGSVDSGKVRLAAGVTRNTVDRIKAGDVIRPVAEQVGGRG
jgi:alanyl-tRNA synthetase